MHLVSVYRLIGTLAPTPGLIRRWPSSLLESLRLQQHFIVFLGIDLDLDLDLQLAMVFLIMCFVLPLLCCSISIISDRCTRGLFINSKCGV